MSDSLFPPPLPGVSKAWGRQGPSLEEVVLANNAHDVALIMYVNPESRWPIAAQKVFLWIKRHVFRRPL